MGCSDHGSLPIHDQCVQADHLVNCPLHQHRALKCPILYSSARDTPHDHHNRQALTLQDRGQDYRVSTAPYHLLPQVWQVYDSQGHGEADGAHGTGGM